MKKQNSTFQSIKPPVDPTGFSTFPSTCVYWLIKIMIAIEMNALTNAVNNNMKAFDSKEKKKKSYFSKRKKKLRGGTNFFSLGFNHRNLATPKNLAK